MKRVLIITYYWPPAGGVAVQRWLKFAKYLPEYGWQPIVYCPSNADFPVVDENLSEQIPSVAEILKAPIWEPFTWYKRFLGLKQESKIQQNLTGINQRSWKAKLAMWVRANFFIPDARRFWVQPSVKRLSKYLQSNSVEVIVTNGTPHSTHLIGYTLKQRFPEIKWLADFRDPWTGIDYFEKLPLTSWALKRHQSLEQKVVQSADIVQTVSPSWAADFKKMGAKRVSVITNGYDLEDVNHIVPNLPNDKIVYAHVGTLNEERNPVGIWKKIAETKHELPFEIRLVGKTDLSILESLSNFGLSNKVKLIDQVSHQEALQEIANAHYVILCVSNTNDIKGRIPAKVFEYKAFDKTILLDNTDAKDLLEIINETDITLFERKSLTKKLSETFNHLL